MGYENATDIQAQSIPLIMEGKDVPVVQIQEQVKLLHSVSRRLRKYVREQDIRTH